MHYYKLKYSPRGQAHARPAPDRNSGQHSFR